MILKQIYMHLLIKLEKKDLEKTLQDVVSFFFSLKVLDSQKFYKKKLTLLGEFIVSF